MKQKDSKAFTTQPWICVCAAVLFISCCVQALFAQMPAGYYNGAGQKKGAELKSAVFAIINKHKQLLDRTQADPDNFLQLSALEITVKKGLINKLDPDTKRGINDRTECVVVFDRMLLEEGGNAFREALLEKSPVVLFNDQQNNTGRAFMKYLVRLGTTSSLQPAAAPLPVIIRK